MTNLQFGAITMTYFYKKEPQEFFMRLKNVWAKFLPLKNNYQKILMHSSAASKTTFAQLSTKTFRQNLALSTGVPQSAVTYKNKLKKELPITKNDTRTRVFKQILNNYLFAIWTITEKSSLSIGESLKMNSYQEVILTEISFTSGITEMC